MQSCLIDYCTKYVYDRRGNTVYNSIYYITVISAYTLYRYTSDYTCSCIIFKIILNIL